MMRNSQASMQKQKGSVLFMALVFLVLTALIAVTTMDTGILARKMAGNNQFKEDAMQVTEGVSNEVARRIKVLLTENTAPQLYDVVCMKASTNPKCTAAFKVLEVSPSINSAAANGELFYQATLVAEATKLGDREIDSAYQGSKLTKYFEIESSFDGVSSGLASAALSVGLKVWFPSSESGGAGGGELAGDTGSGNYTN